MVTRETDELRTDIAGFEAPICPNCNVKAALDDHGFYCDMCLEEIDNGSEFDDLLAELKESKNVPRTHGP